MSIRETDSVTSSRGNRLTNANLAGISTRSYRPYAASNTIENARSVSPAASRQRTAPATRPSPADPAARRLSRCTSPGGASAAPSAASRPPAGDTARCPGPVPSPSRTAARPPSAGALPRRRCAPTTLAQLRVQSSATDVRSKNSDTSGDAVEQLVGEQIGHHRGPPRELRHRSRDVGAVLEPGGGEAQAATQPSVRRQSVSTSLAVRRCSPSAVNSSAVWAASAPDRAGGPRRASPGPATG